MPCTVPYSRVNKTSPVVSKKRGTTFIELIFSLLIVTLLLMPVGFAVNRLIRTGEGVDESVFLTKIRTRIMRTSAESLNDLKESKIVYNKGDDLNGFEFNGELRLEFTHYGQIKMGRSVIIRKGQQQYRLTVRPITGVVSLKKNNGSE